MTTHKVLGYFLFACVFATTPVFARDITFLSSLLPQLKQQGSGKFVYWGFVVYEATLYRDADANSKKFSLDIHYHKPLTGLAIANKSAEEMRKLGVSENQVNIWRKELSALFPDIESGHTLTAVYLPPQRTIFFHNGKPIGEIHDMQFAKAFFSIWLDQKTSAPKLRRDLLGKNCPPLLIDESC